MPNNSYIRGTKLERDIVTLFKKQGYASWRSAGSHGFADVIVTRKAGDALDLMRPITTAEIDEVLAGWLPVHDPSQVLDPFLYGKVNRLRTGGEQRIHLTPATVWLMQLKTKKGKPGDRKRSGEKRRGRPENK